MISIIILVIVIGFGSVEATACTCDLPPMHKSQTQLVTSARKASRACRKSNTYRFVVIENPSRKKDADPVVPQDVNIVDGDRISSKIELPKESEAKNFSLNAIKKDRVGFVMKTDWGGGLYHYEVRFNFRCKQGKFYLYRVTKISFSTTNPDSGNFWDKKESKVTKIEPNLPIERFVMIHYL